MKRHHRAGLVSACVAALASGGCSTTSVVQSAPITSQMTADALGRGRPYLNYFLPQTVLIATVKEKSDGSDKDDKENGPTATVNNAITIDGKDVKPDKTDKKDDADAEAPVDCKKTARAFDGVRQAHAIYLADRKIDLKGLDDDAAWMDRAMRLRPRDGAAIEKRLAAANLALDAVQSADEKDRTRLVQVAKLAATINVACKPQWKVEVSTVVVPDRQHPYALLLQDDDFSADTVSAKVDASGLLTSVSTTADEKSGEALAGIAKSLGTIVGTLSPVTVPAPAKALPPAPGATSALEFAYVRAPLEARIAKFHQRLAALERLDLPGLIAELPKPPANPFRFTVAELDGKTTPLGETGFSLAVSCSAVPGALTRGAEIPPRTASGTPYRAAIEGVAISTPRACEVIAQKQGEEAGPHPVWSVLALDSAAPSEGYLLRTQLIKRGSVYTLDGGRVTEVSSDKPSTGLAVVALPGTVIGGLFSGVVSGIQGPQGMYKAQADYLNAKASVYSAQAALEDAKAGKKTDDKADDSSKSGSTK
jgi:hypothetical protein